MYQSALLPWVSVFCTRDGPDGIGRAFGSTPTEDHWAFDVLLVDESRGDETDRIMADVRESFLHVRYLRLRNPGLSCAYDAGIREIQSELPAFIDDEVILPGGWLRSLGLAFDRQARGALLYGQAGDPTGARSAGQPGRGEALAPHPRREVLDRQHGLEVFGMGANVTARRSLFQCIGGYCVKQVRPDNPYAAWRLNEFLASAMGIAKALLTGRPVAVLLVHLSHIVADVRWSLRFQTDRPRRLHRSPEQA